MKQTSFASLEYAGKKRKTRREKFFSEMDRVVPWPALIALIEPRDPQMHQAKQGDQWHFGMKAHIGVDADSGLVHSVHATAANEIDVAHTHELLHGQEVRVHADAGYTGVDNRDEIAQAQDEGGIRKDVQWFVATKRGMIKTMPEGPLKERTVLVERKKTQIRVLVEHPFHVIKNLFSYKKVSDRGLHKNGARLYAQFALVNLVLAKRTLLNDQCHDIGASWVRRDGRIAMNCVSNRARRPPMRPDLSHREITMPLEIGDRWIRRCSLP